MHRMLAPAARSSAHSSSKAISPSRSATSPAWYSHRHRSTDGRAGAQGLRNAVNNCGSVLQAKAQFSSDARVADELKKLNSDPCVMLVAPDPYSTYSYRPFMQHNHHMCRSGQALAVQVRETAPQGRSACRRNKQSRGRGHHNNQRRMQYSMQSGMQSGMQRGMQRGMQHDMQRGMQCAARNTASNMQQHGMKRGM